MSFFFGSSPQAVMQTAPSSWVEQQTLRGIGSNRTRLYVDYNGDLYGQFENNTPKKIVSLKGAGASSVDSVPIGAVFQWIGGTAPLGYLMCDGSAANDYPQLSKLLASWGGRTPDLRGRYVIGASNTTPSYTQSFPGPLTISSTGGDTEFVIDIQNVPEHTHQVDAANVGFSAGDVELVSGSASLSGGGISGGGVDIGDLDVNADASVASNAITGAVDDPDSPPMDDNGQGVTSVVSGLDGSGYNSRTYVASFSSAKDYWSSSEMDHRHTIPSGTITSDAALEGSINYTAPTYTSPTLSYTDPTVNYTAPTFSGGKTEPAGANKPNSIEKLPPYIALNFIIKHD